LSFIPCEGGNEEEVGKPCGMFPTPGPWMLPKKKKNSEMSTQREKSLFFDTNNSIPVSLSAKLFPLHTGKSCLLEFMVTCLW
jgi:hypothetical protein